MRYMNDFKAYESLALGSFREYGARLNSPELPRAETISRRTA